MPITTPLSTLAVIFLIVPSCYSETTTQVTTTTQPPLVVECKAMANWDDVKVSKGIKREDCLWNELSKLLRPDKSYKGYERYGPFTKTRFNQQRPTPQRKLTVTLKDMHLRSYYINENSQTFSVGFNVVQQWKDERLTWTPRYFGNLKSVGIWEWRHWDDTPNKTPYRIWVPKMNLGHRARNRRYRYYGHRDKVSKSKVQSDGAVELHTSVYWSKTVQLDYTNFPYDKQRVCFDYYYVGRPNEINPQDVIIDGSAAVKASQKNFRADSWLMKNHYWKYFGHEMVKRANKKNGYHICFTVQRISPTAHIELVLPMVGASIAAMVAPGVGALRMQWMVKLAAFFMQIYCIESFGAMTENKKFGDMMPKLLRFQECTIVLTIMSLLTTTFLMMIHRTPPIWGVPSGLSMIMDKIPSCCAIEDDVEGSKTEADQSPKKPNHWSTTIKGLNAISGVIFAGFYILAMVVFCTVK